jgi:hypothetical protein
MNNEDEFHKKFIRELKKKEALEKMLEDNGK